MKKAELVYRELLYQTQEQKGALTQASLSRSLGVSLNTIHQALRPLREMGAVTVRQRSLSVTSVRKLLLYWASVRRLGKDIIYQTRVEAPPAEIEKRMPSAVVFAAYSAYKFRFHSAPADYSEVYVYSADLPELKKRFPPAGGPPNLFILKFVGDVTLAQLFVDLWNLKEWYAKAFLDELERRIFPAGTDDRQGQGERAVQEAG